VIPRMYDPPTFRIESNSRVTDLIRLTCNRALMFEDSYLMDGPHIWGSYSQRLHGVLMRHAGCPKRPPVGTFPYDMEHFVLQDYRLNLGMDVLSMKTIAEDLFPWNISVTSALIKDTSAGERLYFLRP
jgi:hypothetical protein